MGSIRHGARHPSLTGKKIALSQMIAAALIGTGSPVAMSSDRAPL
jgi:hypothetical protein